MERPSSDLPVYLSAVAALAVAGGIIFAVVDAAIVETTADSNTSNGVISGPPASFEQP